MKFTDKVKAKFLEVFKSLDPNSEDKDFLMRPPQHLYVGFFSGIEKEVKDTAKDFVYSYAKDYELQKSRVQYRMLPIKGHPYFGDGYAFEVQVGGDGFSYLEKIFSAFETKTKTLNFKLEGEASVTIRKTPGNIETYYLPDFTMAGELDMEDIDGRKIPTVKLFTENYLFFYISTALMLLGFFAMIGSVAYKEIFYERTETPELKTNVAFVNAMPIANLENARSSSTSRLRAIQYSAANNGSWYKTEEERERGSNEMKEVRVDIKRDGTEVRTTGGSKDD